MVVIDSLIERKKNIYNILSFVFMFAKEFITMFILYTILICLICFLTTSNTILYKIVFMIDPNILNKL